MKTFKIPAEKMSKLDEKFKKINNKATKLGFEKVSYEKIRDVYEDVRENGYDDGEVIHQRHFVEVVIHGNTIKIDGWKFLGTIDHNSLVGVVLVKSVPGEVVPANFHDSDTTCDHCKTKRNRNNTFILQKDTEYMRVGSACIKDFLGHDPKKIASHMELLFNMNDEMSEFEESSGAFEPNFKISKVLEITSAIVRNFGYVSKAKAEMNMIMPTSGSVADYLIGRSEGANELRKTVAVTDEDCKTAEDAVLWLNEQDATNDYMRNLKAIVGCDYMLFGAMGFAVSIIATYKNAMNKKIEENEATDEYVGDVGKRQKMTLTVLYKEFFDNDFGGSYLHKFADATGCTVIWWASNDIDMKVGETYNVKATPKKHELRDGKKQTFVSRVSIEK